MSSIKEPIGLIKTYAIRDKGESYNEDVMKRRVDSYIEENYSGDINNARLIHSSGQQIGEPFGEIDNEGTYKLNRITLYGHSPEHNYYIDFNNEKISYNYENSHRPDWNLDYSWYAPELKAMEVAIVDTLNAALQSLESNKAAIEKQALDEKNQDMSQERS